MVQRDRKAQNRWDNFWEQLEVWGTFTLTNLFWILLSIPIITMPLATAGLFTVMSKWTRGKQPEFFQDFFGGIRQHWMNALVIGLLDMVVSAVVLLNTRLLLMMEEIDPLTIAACSVTLFTGLMLLMMNLYIWSLLVLTEEKLWTITQMSFKLVMAHPLWTFGILIAAVIPILLSLLLPRVVFLFVTVSICALVINRGTWRIIRQYLSDEERQRLEASHL